MHSYVMRIEQLIHKPFYKCQRLVTLDQLVDDDVVFWWRDSDFDFENT